MYYSFYIKIELDGTRRVWIDFDGQYPNNLLQAFQIRATSKLSGMIDFANYLNDGRVSGGKVFYREHITLEFLDNEVHIYDSLPNSEVLIITKEEFDTFLYAYQKFLETYERGGIPNLPFLKDDNQVIDS